VKENTSSDQSLLMDFNKLQKRMARLSKEQKKVTTEVTNLRA